MKYITKRYWPVLILSTVILSLITGCSSMDPKDVDTHYTFANIELTGQVLCEECDTDSGEFIETPISHIRIKLKNTGETAYTNNDGYFVLFSQDANIGVYPELYIDIAFDDVDGEENGGIFGSKTIREPISLLIKGKPVQIDTKITLERIN